MRIALRSKQDPDAELIGLAVGGLAAVMAYVWLHLLHLPVSSGLLQRILHVPCPFCGGTRSAFYLLRGDLPAAFAWNPLVTLGAIAAALWMVYALGAVLCGWRRVRVERVSPLEARLIRVGVVLILGANWVYVWLAGL